jgi:hypothetical protein
LGPVHLDTGLFVFPVSQGGRGLGLVKTTTFFLVICAGKWLRYTSFGFLADAFGRREPYFAYLLKQLT